MVTNRNTVSIKEKLDLIEAYDKVPKTSQIEGATAV